jgi:anti-sigma factor RsiW
MNQEARGNMLHVDDGALHAYLDGELSAVERERLEAHLADCGACRARLDEERGLVERASQLLGLAQPPERAAPPPLHQLRQPRLVWRLRMPLAWAATVVVAVGFGYVLGGGTYRGGPPPASESIRSVTASGTAESSAVPVEVAVAEHAERQRAADAPRARAARSTAHREADKVPDQAAANIHIEGAAAVPVEPRAAAVPPESRLAAAPPLRLDAIVVTAAAETGRVAARDQPVATAWPIIEREAARALLGTDPLGVPGVPVRDLRRSPAGEGVVMVEQQLDSATVIQLFQRRVEPGLAATEVAPPTAQARAPAPAAPAMKVQVRGSTGTERLARFVGSLRVEIAGPLPADSLNKLLERARPIP